MKTQPKEILEKLRNSPLYKEYERAFQVGMQMPVTIRPVETWGLPLQGCQNENPFCALIAGDRKSCAACLEAQQELSAGTGKETNTITCFAGFSESVVPIRHGSSTIGFLQTGQVRTAAPTREGFDSINRQITDWGATIDRKELEAAYHSSSPVKPDIYESRVSMLKQFAEHLESMVNQIVVQSEETEPPLVQRARKFIEENFAEEISLRQVAKAVNTSTFYFCKVFKKATGLTFTEYLTRVRINKAQEMLLHPHTRISEAAFAVGFQSLSQFNRAFKNLTGKSPTADRRNLTTAMVA